MRFAVAAMLWLTPLAASAAIFDDDFQNIEESCGSGWYGDCVADWTDLAATASLAIDDDNGDYTVIITGGSTIPNGMMYTDIPLDSLDEIGYLRANFQLVSGAGQAVIRIVYRDSSGSSLLVETHTVAVDAATDTTGALQLAYSIPNSAVTADILVGAKNPGLDIMVEAVTFDVPSIAGLTCTARAAAMQYEMESTCGTLGGSSNVICIGVTDTGYAGGCRIECTDVCPGINGYADPFTVYRQ